MKNTLIVGHMGLGDNIHTVGMIRHISETTKVTYLTFNHYINTVKAFFADLKNVELYPVKDDSEAHNVLYTTSKFYDQVLLLGDYGKNLRSRDDLTVLGRWLKGRMENSGSLTSGAPVTEAVLKLYGRSFMTLTPTKRTEIDPISGRELKVWTIDFGVNN